MCSTVAQKETSLDIWSILLLLVQSSQIVNLGFDPKEVFLLLTKSGISSLGSVHKVTTVFHCFHQESLQLVLPYKLISSLSKINISGSSFTGLVNM